MKKLNKAIALIVVVLCPYFSLAQVSHTFNSGGQHASTPSVGVSSNFGEVFVNTFEDSNFIVQEGILSSNIIVLSLDDEKTQAIKVYPTSFIDELTIETPSIGHDFTIFNASGQALKRGTLNQHKNTVKLDVPAQWYILKIQSQDDGKVFTFKVWRED